MISMLFTPALRADRAVKAWLHGPDSVILDFEDAVAAERKPEARIHASSAVSEHARPWTVRINDLNSKWWQDDIAAVLHPNLAYLMIPKVQSADQIRTVDNMLSTYEKQSGRETPIRLVPLIESVQGLANARSIATAASRVAALAFGEGDFSLDLGIDWDPFGAPLLVAMVQLVFDSRLAGIEPPHAGVYPKLDDPDGLERSCRLAKSLGFGGKLCIHPEQIPTVVRVFAPSVQAVERAREIVARFEEALARGSASITVGTEFVDYPVYHRAKQTLKNARA